MDKLVIKNFFTNKLKKKKFERYKILKEPNKVIEYLLSTKNPYQIKVGNTIVEMRYMKGNKTFNECILNILKQKSKNLLLDTLK